MTDMLERPYGEDRSFQDIIKGEKSLVVFVRHPG